MQTQTSQPSLNVRKEEREVVQTVPLSPNEILNNIDAYYNRKRRVSPCHTNRASALGDECLRSLVYMRTASDLQEPPSLTLQMIFEEGNIQEKAVVMTLMEAGYEVIKQQNDFHDKELQITGHIDGKLMDKEGNTKLCEIKSMSPLVWNTMKTAEDLNRKPWTIKYPAQCQLYMRAENEMSCLLILKNKSTGEIKIFEIFRDDAMIERLENKARLINQHVKEGTLPERLNKRDHCSMCRFKALCNPSVVNEALMPIDDPELIEAFARRDELAAAHKEYSSVDRSIKSELKKMTTDKALIGDYHVQRKLIQKTGTKPDPEKIIKYYTYKIEKIDAPVVDVVQ